MMCRSGVAALLVVLFGVPLVAQNVTFANHTGTAPYEIKAHGDLNNDGREDFVIVKTINSSQSEIYTRISTADGSYKAGPSYLLPAEGVGGLALADFNRDGKLDLAVAVNSKIYVYLGNGYGSFQLAHTISVGTTVFGLAAADVNHDSKTDLIAETEPSAGDQLNVYLGNGSGGFSTGPVSSLSPEVSNGANIVGFGDLDADGKTDVVMVACEKGGCYMVAAYGDGTGRFGSLNGFGGPDLGDMTVADVNGDGRSDVIASPGLPDNNFLYVFYGNADRTVTAQQIATSGCPYYHRIAVGDYNGDGIPDLMVPESVCNNTAGSPAAQVAFLRGTGGGSFAPEQYIYSSSSFTSSDMVTMLGDRDTEPDLAFTTNNSGTLNVMLNGTSAPFPSCAAPHGVRGIRVCSPLAGSSVTSPVHFAIGAAGSVPMRKVEVWVDGKKVKEVLTAFSDYGFMDTHLTLSAGTHTVTVFAAGWDNSLQRKSFSLTVQ